MRILAVTCHLHFWQNDRGLLRATVCLSVCLCLCLSLSLSLSLHFCELGLVASDGHARPSESALIFVYVNN